MDFVVVGFGLGALAILLGVFMQGWQARRWERSALTAATPDDRTADLAMAGWRRDSGQALLTAGSALLIATIAALAGGLDDRIGAYLVTTTATVAALGLLLWGFLYRARRPTPPRRRTRPPVSSQAIAPVASARGALPALGDGAFAAERRNGSGNGVADDLLDDADVRVVALEMAPIDPEEPSAETEDTAPDTSPEMDSDEAVVANAGDDGEDAPAIALVQATAPAASARPASAGDGDDEE